MPECQNCGEHVTEQYVAVFAPNGRTHPRCCPSCQDKIRGSDGKVRDARARRQGNGEDPVTYDPDLAADGGQQ